MRTFFLLGLTILLTAAASVVEAREFRAAWVASVWNLDFPSKMGLSTDQQEREIIRILDAAKAVRLNALFLQVRPEGDALYTSNIEPWSRYLTGRQGVSPGFDPLQTFIIEGKKRGIEIHAWFNPYRAAVSASNKRSSNHLSYRLGANTKRVGNMLWMDPGSPAVQDHIVNVVRDVVRRYDVAGVHLDDYFYPYPDVLRGRSFPDSTTYGAYRRSGGNMPLADWRRDNVNTIVRRIYVAVKQEKAGVEFGVSPFGTYTKGQPADVEVGLDQFNQIYSDPVKWLREGWVDYLAPQLYWRDGGPQSFSKLLRWWRSPEVNPRGIPIYPGIALERLGGSYKWPVSEIARQLVLEKTIGPRREGGFILYHMKPILQNTKSVCSIIAKQG